MEMESLIEELVKTLANNNYINKKQKSTITIPSDRFASFLGYVIGALTIQNMGDVKKRNPDFYFAVHLLPKIDILKRTVRMSELTDGDVPGMKEALDRKIALEKELVHLDSLIAGRGAVNQEYQRKEDMLDHISALIEKQRVLKGQL